MDDTFDLEYADELDALDNFCPDEDSLSQPYNPPKSKRTLQFQTPKRNDKKDLEVVDDSHLDSIPESPRSLVINGADHDEGNKERGVTRKRQPSDEDWMDETETDSSFFEHSQPISSRKKARLDVEQESVDQSLDPLTVRLIEQIQQHRQKSHLHTEDKRDWIASQHRMNDAEDTERSRVHKHIPKGDFVSTVGYEGDRVYMKLWDEEVLEAEYVTLGREARSTNLLPVPVCLMREKMEEEMSRKIFQESIDLQESIARQLEDDPMDDDVTSNVDNNRQITDNTNRDETEAAQELTKDMRSLWVEKYAPSRYTELLSEESINRSMLHWLKLWDFVVFGKDVPKPQKQKTWRKDNEKEKKFKKFQAEVIDNLDNHNRPQQMIALLCGPPGLGKTTLAHIVANHAGYNVVEMNASDDRSAEVFRNKLESATQMKSVAEADPRPNCLVIDEIDGAPLPAINTLLNTMKKPDGEKSKKKKEGGLLLRPIICVCNDQFVPALRQLRQNALVLNFPQTEPHRLASRLNEVVRIEQLKADINALLALCERTDNDIRSCLNTLQFVRQKQKELTLRDVQTMSVGQKDTQKSLFSVWDEVFTMPRQKKNRFVSMQDLIDGKQENLNNNNITPSVRFSNILELCFSAGESERVMQGLHENYLDAKSKDPHLHGLTLANEWLCFSDCLNQYIAKSQDYSVMKFSPFTPIVFHFLYASNTPTKIKFPQGQHETFLQTTKTNNLLTSLISDMVPLVRKFNNPRTIILDLLPPLLDILHPTMRPVNAQLYSTREKAELSNVVDIMIAYNMTYHQEKSPEGQYVYSLDPNVEEIVKFSGLKPRKQLTYAAKQMIAREIDLEKMRRSDKKLEPVPENKTNKVAETDKKKTPAPAVPNHLRKLQAKTIDEDKITDNAKPAVNFFGNFVRTKRAKVEKTTETGETLPDPKKNKALLDTLIWFHFKEGYSNAVRRNVKVEDFL